MTTLEIIKKAKKILGKELEIESIYFKTSFNFNENTFDISITVFYKIPDEKYSNFTATVYSGREDCSIENLLDLLKVEYRNALARLKKSKMEDVIIDIPESRIQQPATSIQL